MTGSKPELLAPAGTPEALSAAIEAGADAVYFGSTAFSCRMRAGNFDDGAMRDAIAKCRAYGVKAYITVNTRLRDGELNDAAALTDLLYDAGADALIITDPALVEEVRRRHPDFELHASTQCSGANSEDAKVLAALGFSRMVCPRELSEKQIKTLCGSSPIGIEMFLHGAHCASFSGQCLASFAMGGRSGNRGECAQPCRLAYGGAAGDSHPLSLKDMCLASHITDIMKLGVASLKIEGRQKSAGYVYGVTSVYRRLLDEGRNATPDELAALARLFSRDGFTDGYFRRDYRRMTGVRHAGDADVSREEDLRFTGLTRRVPLDMKFTLKNGEAASLTVTAHKISARAEGEMPKAAVNQPVTPESARKNLGKLGGSAYELAAFDADIDDGLFMTAAELNSLRRAALDELDRSLLRLKRGAAVTDGTDTANSYRAATDSAPDPAATREAESDRYGIPHFPETAGNADACAESLTDSVRSKNTVLSAEFLKSEQIPDVARAFFDEIYVPAAEYTRGSGYGIALAPIMTDEGTFPSAEVADAGLVLANSFSEISLSLKAGAQVVASYRMNAFGKGAAEELARLGCSALIASPEIPLGAVRAMKAGTVAYGRLPLMHLLRCPQAKNGYCRGIGGYTPDGKRGGGYCVSVLKDRTGASLPLIGYPDCVNVLFNAVPVYMADRSADLRGVSRLHFIFTTETRDEVAAVIDAYRKHAAPEYKVRRIK